MANEEFKFLAPNGGLSALASQAIENMTLPQFAQYEGNLVNVRRKRYYDMGIWKTNTMVTPNDRKTLFRKGLEQQDTLANDSAAEFTKTLVHTNLLKDGEFEQGDTVIIKGVEIEFPMFGGKPGTKSYGAVTNPKATFPATFDPALTAYSWLSQLLVQFREGNRIIFEGLAIDFPQRAGIAAAFGANSGAYVQNGSTGDPLMPNPRVLRGGYDFSVVLQPLANFDLTTATGIDMEISTKVVLQCIELDRSRE